MNILVFFAHPDDETMLCGGLLALLAKSGHLIHYLCSTRGEGGECGDPPLCSQKNLGSLREKELFCAVQALGGKSLIFLDYIDPIVGADNTLYPFTDDTGLLMSQLREQIQSNEIDVLISHGSNGEYGHPGHRIIYQVTKELLNMNFPKLSWYTVQAFYENSSKPHILNKDDQADWILDVTSVLDLKINAALCHKSQHALFVRRKSNELGKLVSVPEIIPTQESYHLAKGKKDLLMEIPILSSSLIRFHNKS